MRNLLITAAAGGGILLLLAGTEALGDWLATMPWAGPVLLVALVIGTTKLLLAIMRAANTRK